MVKVHVECLPDEALAKKLGISRKMVIHHAGKSKVFNKISKTNHEIAMVDEDPESPKSANERNLVFVEELFGIKQYRDNRGNKILVLKIKLEDWIISSCREANVDITDFGLPDVPNRLHDVIIQRLNKFEKLIDHLIRQKCKGILQLKTWLNN